MLAPSAEALTAQALAARLKLKRKFLVALIVSLAASTAIAVGVFLFGTFNDTTFRIMGSLAALALHSLIAMMLASAIEQRRNDRLHSVGLVLFAFNFLGMLACIWWPLSPVSRGLSLPLRGAFTTLLLIGYYLLAAPGTWLWEKRRWLPLPQATVLACAIGLGLGLMWIWRDLTRDSKEMLEAMIVAGIMAFSLAHTCLLVPIPVSPAHRWALSGAIVCVWAVAAAMSYMIVAENFDEFMIRTLGTLGALDFAGSLILLVLAKLRQVTGTQQLESTIARLEIRCPRCSQTQVLDAGASQCHACGLKFRIEIEEPRCVKCGYLQWQLPERRCPECGTTF